MPPQALRFMDGLFPKSARFQKARPPEAIEWMELVRTSKHRFEAWQQQGHRQDVLPVMGEDRIHDIGMTVAEPGEIAARDHCAGQIIGAMQVQHCLLDRL